MKPNPIHKVWNGFDFTRFPDKYKVNKRWVWAVACPHCDYTYEFVAYVSRTTRKTAKDNFYAHMRKTHITASKAQIQV